MVTKEEILIALNELYKKEGTQKRLSELAGITQSTINAYLNSKASIENMPVGVLLKLFRDMKIDFFGGTKEVGNISSVRNRLLNVFDSLSDEQKIECFGIVVANFPDQILKETKR